MEFNLLHMITLNNQQISYTINFFLSTSLQNLIICDNIYHIPYLDLHQLAHGLPKLSVIYLDRKLWCIEHNLNIIK